MGCGASKDRVVNDPYMPSEPIEQKQQVENLDDTDRQNYVVQMGNNTNRDYEEYKKSPVSLKSKSRRNNMMRNLSQNRGINKQGNQNSSIDDIEELHLNDTTKQETTNNIGLKQKQNNQYATIDQNRNYQLTPEKSLSQLRLNGFNYGNDQVNRKTLKGQRSREGSLSSESRNQKSQLQISYDGALQINKTSQTQLNVNSTNIEQQNAPKALNFFQMKKNNQNTNAVRVSNNQVLERDAGKIQDLSLHLLDKDDNKNEKNTSSTICIDTHEGDNDPLFAITVLKPPLQKTNEYIEFKVSIPPVLSHEIYKPEIDFTKENKLKSFNKDGIFNANSSKKAQPIDKKVVEDVRNLMFGTLQNKYLPKSWSQGFIINENDMYGLIQKEGGPCGVISVVQAFYIKYLLIIYKGDESQIKKKSVQENCLLAALSEVLYKCRTVISNNNYLIKFVIAKQQTGASFKACDIGDCQEINFFASKFEDIYNSLREVKEELIGNYNNGVINFLYSVILTKGVQNIISQMDMAYSSIIGAHGHATQELVNLLITGEARSNCFDGIKDLGGSMKLYGIQKRSQIGFLSALECDQLIEVGQNYKKPYLPIWILCKENHYTTLFARDCRIIENTLWHKFDIMWYDQLSEQGHFLHKITIEKDSFLRNKKFTRENDALQILNKNNQNILHTKWGSDISINWNGKSQLL